MKLPLAGREYAKWPVLEAPLAAALEVSFDDGAFWWPMIRTETSASVLVAGPDALDNPFGTVVLAAGLHVVSVRLADNPEVVIRDGGWVYVA